MKRLPINNFEIRCRVRNGFQRSYLSMSKDNYAITNRCIAPIALYISRRIFLSRLRRYVSSKYVSIEIRLRHVSRSIDRLIMSSIVRTFRKIRSTSLCKFRSIFSVKRNSLRSRVQYVIRRPILVRSTRIVCNEDVGAIRQLMIKIFLEHVFLVCFIFVFGFITRV